MNTLLDRLSAALLRGQSLTLSKEEIRQLCEVVRIAKMLVHDTRALEEAIARLTDVTHPTTDSHGKAVPQSH